MEFDLFLCGLCALCDLRDALALYRQALAQAVATSKVSISLVVCRCGSQHCIKYRGSIAEGGERSAAYCGPYVECSAAAVQRGGGLSSLAFICAPATPA